MKNEILTKKSRGSFLQGLLIYTAVFIIMGAFSFFPVLKDTGSLFTNDSIGQYYPFLLDTRRNLIAFFDSIAKGQPALPMLDLTTGFGEDLISTAAINFIPFLPYYIFSVLVPEEGIALYLSCGTVLMSYISGVSFLILCRHFGKELRVSGVFSCFYVFCGSYFTYGLFFPHFLYMSAAFPLMLVGMDRIINDKSHTLFTLSVFFLFLCGFVLPIYTIPFVMIFAAVRVRFVYAENYPRMLLRYFLRGAGACILGIALSCVTLLPFTAELLSSGRSLGSVPDILGLLIPSSHDLSVMLAKPDGTPSTAMCAAAVPFFAFAMISPSSKKELKALGLITIVLVSFPIVRYGFNGFQYDHCRWGFVPAALGAYCCCEYFPKLRELTKRQKALFAASALIYAALYTLRLYDAAAVSFALLSVISCVPFLRSKAVKLADKALSALKKLPEALKRLISSDKRILLYAAASLALFGLVFAAIDILSYKKYDIIPPVLITGAVCAAAVLLPDKTGRKKLFSAFICVCLCIGCIAGFENAVPVMYERKSNVFFEALPSEKTDGDSFLRWCNVFNDRYITDSEAFFAGSSQTESSEAESKEDAPAVSAYPSDTFENYGARYDSSAAEQFSSTINGDYFRFLKRCGQDGQSVMSSGKTKGYAGKEVLYTLFGISRVFSYDDCKPIYGTELSEVTDFGTYKAYTYTNPYVLPVGTLYTEFMSGSEFEGCDPAGLPYLMLSRAYVSGYGPSESAAPGGSVSALLDITAEKRLRGTTSFGIDVYDNSITINGSTRDCFLCITFDGVRTKTYDSSATEPLDIETDSGKLITQFFIMNENAYFPWHYTNDSYTLSLGMCEEDIKELSFISRFEYNDVRLYAIPLSVYTDACAERQKARLENVRIGTNEISGKINTADDGIMMFDLMYSTGYSAYIDGKPSPIYKVNGLFPGTAVPKGEHEVVLRYRTPLLYEGAFVSVCGAVVFAVSVILSKKRRSGGKKPSLRD